MKIFNFDLINIILVVSSTIIFIFFIYAGIISLLEKEKKASGNFIIFAITSTLPFILTGFFEFRYHFAVSMILLSLLFILVMIYFLPIRFRRKIFDNHPNNKIDERDTMFSRNELEKGSGNYKKYYKNHPERQKVDNDMKNNPGLLAERSFCHDHIMFASANASFFTIDALKSKIDNKVSSNKIETEPKEISKYIKNRAKKLGALNVGITELKDYHKYDFRGRKENYGKKVNLNHKYAIAITVEMDYNSVRSGPQAPIVMESAQQYLAAGSIAVQLADFIRQLGHPAKAHIDGNYEVVCPLVAKDAGLGELGRMGLLMTPKHGPRVRIAVITTDIPLISDKKSFNPSVIEFCGNCKKCAVNCPSNAISYKDRVLINGVERWKIDQEKCFDFWTKCGTDCGRCISVCPYSHPNNTLHNIIRFGIKNSSIFSKLALYLDDIFYGKNPVTIPPAKWMKVKLHDN